VRPSISIRRGGGLVPVVFVPGFMQRGDAWEAVAERVGERYRSVCLDPASVTLEERLSEIRETGARGSVLVGYSMGGRLVLHSVLRDPARYSALVTLGSHAGIEDKGERASRRVADAEFAAWIERSPVKAIVARWEAQPLFKTQAGELLAEQRPGRLAHEPEQLATLLRSCGQGAMTPVWDRLGEIEIPALCIAGELDRPYVEAAERMASLLPTARTAIVAGAGHAAHLEDPDSVGALLAEFLDQHFG
jgi:2-succinyl-6-hydroxy-2,4-cyclohexadiene-1-carboxylate synthase